MCAADVLWFFNRQLCLKDLHHLHRKFYNADKMWPFLLLPWFIVLSYKAFLIELREEIAFGFRLISASKKKKRNSDSLRFFHCWSFAIKMFKKKHPKENTSGGPNVGLIFSMTWVFVMRLREFETTFFLSKWAVTPRKSFKKSDTLAMINFHII